jgi:hypothetical protein
MGWFDVVRDWQLVKKQKQGFLEALQMTPPGAGLSIKDPANPITARALIELLRDFPNQFEVLDYGFEVTIMRKVGMVQAMSPTSHDTLTAKHHILSSQSLHTLGLKDSDRLPARKWRDGIPDDVNGPREAFQGEVTIERP